MHCFTQASQSTKEGIVKKITKMSTDLLTGHKKKQLHLTKQKIINYAKVTENVQKCARTKNKTLHKNTHAQKIIQNHAKSTKYTGGRDALQRTKQKKNTSTLYKNFTNAANIHAKSNKITGGCEMCDKIETIFLLVDHCKI